MGRSLIAVVLGVLLGLATARVIDVLVLAPGVPISGGQLPALVQAGHIIGWVAAAFAGATTTLLIGRRWSPVGYLTTASMGLLALLGLSSGEFHPVAWPFAGAGVCIGGVGAVRVTNASRARGAPGSDNGDAPGMFT